MFGPSTEDTTDTNEKYVLRQGANPPERFEGAVHGHKGTFVLQHNAGGSNGEPWLTWKIVETSGTGDLAGLRGEGQIIIGEDGGHSYTLDYETL